MIANIYCRMRLTKMAVESIDDTPVDASPSTFNSSDETKRFLVKAIHFIQSDQLEVINAF